MNKNQTFFGNAFYYTIGVIAAQGTTFAALMILGRLMSPEQYAPLSIYGIWASIFGMIAGVQAHGSLNNAKLDFGPEKLNAYTSSTYGMGLVSLAVLLGVVLLFQNFFTAFTQFSLTVVLFAVLQGFFSFTIQHLANKYRVLNRPKPFIFWTASVAVARLAISVPLVMQITGNKYLGDVYGSFIAYTAIGAVAAVVIIAKGKTLFRADWWKYCIVISLPFVFSGLANLVLGQSDRLMLQALSTPAQTGVYSYVYNIGLVSMGVWTAFNYAWSVWYFDKTHVGEKDQIVHLYKKYCLFVTFLSVAFVLVSPDIVRILGGQEYQGGIYMIPLIAAGCFFFFLYTFPVAYESYRQKTVYIAIGTVAAAALNIGLNFYFIPRWGGMGAAITTLISYVMLFIFHYIIAKYVLKGFELSFVHLLVPALMVGAALAASYLFIDIWPVRWIVGVLLLAFSFKIYRQSRHIMME